MKPFDVTKIDNSIVKFTILRNLTIEDFRKMLGLVSSLIDKSKQTGKPFSFYVDAREIDFVPLNAQVHLITWLKTNRPNIKGNLNSSAVVIKSSALRDLLNTAFKIQPTVSPNLITLEVAEAEKFVKKFHG